MGAGGQTEGLHCLFQQINTFVVGLADRLDPVTLQAGVKAVVALKPCAPPGLDPLRNGRTRFARRRIRPQQFLAWPRHLDAQVDAVKQRTRDAIAVSLHAIRTAVAITLRVAQVATRT